MNKARCEWRALFELYHRILYNGSIHSVKQQLHHNHAYKLIDFNVLNFFYATKLKFILIKQISLGRKLVISLCFAKWRI
jgi:hypothetical protein